MNIRKEEKGMFMSLKDWRNAIRTPPSYRVGKNTFKFQTQYIIGISVLSILILFMFLKSSDVDKKPRYSVHDLDKESDFHRSYQFKSVVYNSTYPLTTPQQIHGKWHFQIGVVSDMDHSSRSTQESNTWISTYLTGTLIWDPSGKGITINWDKQNYKTLKSKYSYSGRGMELSELVTFDGKLISFDDRSGLVYTIENNKVSPWVLLTDGDGHQNKGFKAEWATVKDEHLYIGSMGKEWTTPTGELVNYNPMWVKKISRTGQITSLDWKDNYYAIRATVGVHFPGYMLHESACWSDYHNKWFFLPRRMSHDSYNEEHDEFQGTNLIISCDDQFKHCQVTQVGEVIPTRGFSSFKFIPGTRDEIIVALKSYEVHGKVETYIMAFDINGKILSGEKKVDDFKFEGFEFI